MQGIDSATLCGLDGRNDNPIPARFLTPIDCYKIPAQVFSRNLYEMKYEEPAKGPWKSLYGTISPWFMDTMVETEKGEKAWANS